MQKVIYFIIGVCIFREGLRDFFNRKISLVTVVIIAVMGMVLHLVENDLRWYGVLGGALIGTVLLLIARVTGEGIGYGDGWMLVATGIVLGFQRNFLLFCCALVLCSIASIFLLLFRKAGKKTELPFISFLLPAFIVVCMTG